MLSVLATFNGSKKVLTHFSSVINVDVPNALECVYEIKYTFINSDSLSMAL